MHRTTYPQIVAAVAAGQTLLYSRQVQRRHDCFKLVKMPGCGRYVILVLHSHTHPIYVSVSQYCPRRYRSRGGLRSRRGNRGGHNNEGTQSESLISPWRYVFLRQAPLHPTAALGSVN